MDVAGYHDFLGKYSRTYVASVEVRRMEAEGGAGIEYWALVEDLRPLIPSVANLLNLRAQLLDAIGPLEEREKLITTLYL